MAELFPTPVRLQVLGSSSAGNCTLLWHDGSVLLVDCGFPPYYLARHLEAVGLSLASVTGVVLTHVHGDHVNGQTVDALAELRTPIIIPPEIEKPLTRIHPAAARAAGRGLLRKMKGGEAAVGSFGLEAFPVPHDSPGGCFGYSIHRDGAKITIATDLSHPLASLAGRFADSRLIVLESNHDPAMLEGSARPDWLKRRIRERGHLANEQCAELLVGAIGASSSLPGTILLAHVSRECNTNALALGCTRDALARAGVDGVAVGETFPDRPSALVALDG